MIGRNDQHVLLIAFACEPNYGSEPGVGWDTAVSLARLGFRVHVVTHACHRTAVEGYLNTHREADDALGRITFTYFKLQAPLAWLRKCQPGLNLYYYAWQLAAGRLVKRLHAEHSFDVVQHVTYARYWMPSGGAALAGDAIGVPFVWGPVGGGENMPRAFRDGIGLRGKVLDTFRRLARATFELDPMLRRTIRRASLVLATTPETAARLHDLGAQRVEVCSAIGWADALGQSDERGDRTACRFLSAGRLLYWKGFHLALKAFAAAKVPNAEYIICGDGPDRARLEQLARDLNIADRVTFRGGAPRDAFLADLAACDVLLHPSLHDSGGAVCLEAMGMGKPVICLKLGGPGTIVDDQSGVRIDATATHQAIRDLADAMSQLARDPQHRQQLGQGGKTRCRDVYGWDHRVAQLAQWYGEARHARAQSKTNHPDLAGNLELRNANS